MMFRTIHNTATLDACLLPDAVRDTSSVNVMVVDKKRMQFDPMGQVVAVRANYS